MCPKLKFALAILENKNGLKRPGNSFKNHCNSFPKAENFLT